MTDQDGASSPTKAASITPERQLSAGLWRLDSLADELVAVKQQQKRSGLFGRMSGSLSGGFCSLASTLSGTRSRLCKLLAAQLNVLPASALADDTQLAGDQDLVHEAMSAPSALWFEPVPSPGLPAASKSVDISALAGCSTSNGGGGVPAAAAAGAPAAPADDAAARGAEQPASRTSSVQDDMGRPGELTQRVGSYYNTPFAAPDVPDPLEAAAAESRAAAAAAATACSRDGPQRSGGSAPPQLPHAVGSSTPGQPTVQFRTGSVGQRQVSWRPMRAGSMASSAARAGSLAGRLPSSTNSTLQHGGPSRRFSRLSSVRDAGVPLMRASTLMRMETANAWWELHELEMQQSSLAVGASRALTRGDTISRSAFAQPGAAPPSLDAAAQQQEQGLEVRPPLTPTPTPMIDPPPRRGLLRGVLRVLSTLSSGSSTGGSFSARFASLLNLPSRGGTPIFGRSIVKTPHKTMSTDGWTLHLMHTVDTGLQPHERKRHPILMCPGLASSGPGTFDLLPKVSIVDFLAAEGYDVWYIDIRGNGLADKESRIDIEKQWNIDDYLVQDVPACIEYVLKHSEADMLHWMGHSMGGMLGTGLCSQGGKWGKRLRSVMLVGSGCFGDGSWHCVLKKLVVPVTKFGFPAQLGTQALALLANTPAALSVFETLFYWCWNMDTDTRQALLMNCFNFIPERLVAQFLATHDSPTGLQNAAGTFLYADPDVLAACKVPVLGLNGDWDLFCPAPGGEKTVNLFAGPKKHVTFGPAHGQHFHYGHFDVVVGKHAREEVWPHIRDWLAEHDAPASEDDLWDAIPEWVWAEAPEWQEQVDDGGA